MATTVYDVNTTTEADGATGPGELYQPLRTVTGVDAVRVTVWQRLSTVRGEDPFDETVGLDIEDLLDAGTSDRERAAAVQAEVERDPGVAVVTSEPVVTTSDDGQTATISVEAETIYGSAFSVGVAV